MGLQEGVDGVVRIFQVAQLARAGGAALAAGGGEALGDAVIAECALVGDFLLGVKVAAAVGTGLHAVGATEAVGLVDENDSVRRDKGGADRADLGAGRVGA